MSEKLIALSGAEVKVTFSGGNAWLRNDGASAVYAAKTAGITAGADGVVSIPAGGSAPVYGANGTVFLLGAGEVQLIGSDYATNPFVGDSFGGGAGISTNAAGIVTLDGLQGGVPFSDITLSGDDIVGQGITLTACGKNLLKYPYANTTKTINGITFTDNGDGTVTANGTATGSADFYIITNLRLNSGKYVLSGCPEGGSNTGYKLQAYGDTLFNTGFGIMDTGNNAPFEAPEAFRITRLMIRFLTGVTADGLVFKPQLEIGGAATEYEPYSGSTIAITPDSAPYTATNDIRQQEGINNVSVSAGEVTVTGVRRNAAIGKIWAKLDELTAAIIVSNGEI